jgi:hypothetical protein
LAYLALGGWGLLQAAGTPTLTRKVRDGWIGRTFIAGLRTFNGGHETFVAKFRSGVAVLGCRRGPEMQEPMSATARVFFGLTLITIGVVYPRCRRI